MRKHYIMYLCERTLWAIMYSSSLMVHNVYYRAFPITPHGSNWKCHNTTDIVHVFVYYGIDQHKQRGLKCDNAITHSAYTIT